jgi:hypothetical protein
MQSLTPADIPPSFLLPSLSGGLRSLRHIVVLRRAQAHLGGIKACLADTNPMGKEDAALICKKLFLVERHIEELEWYVTRHPTSRVVAGLKSVKEDFAAFVCAVAADDEEVEVEQKDGE